MVCTYSILLLKEMIKLRLANTNYSVMKGLHKVATTGDFNDLINLPEPGDSPELNQIKQQITAVDTKVNNANTEIGKVNIRVDNSNIEITKVDTKVNNTNSELSKTNTNVTNVSNKANRVDTEVINARTTTTGEVCTTLEDRITKDINNVKDNIINIDNKTITNLNELSTARTTVKGEACDDLDKRLLKDFSDVKETIDTINYIESNGTFDRTLSGELRDVNVEGVTYQNLKGMFDKSVGNCTYTKDSDTSYFPATNDTGGTITFDGNLLSANKTYTIIMNITKNNLVGSSKGVKIELTSGNGAELTNWFNIDNGVTGILKKVINTTEKQLNKNIVVWRRTGYTGEFEIKNFIILEGDYTNKPIPSYFEGIESVAEREKIGDKYQLPIKVKGKNLFDKNTILNKSDVNADIYETEGYVYIKSKRDGVKFLHSDTITLKSNTTYTIDGIKEVVTGTGSVPKIRVAYLDETTGILKTIGYSVSGKYTFTTTEETKNISLGLYATDSVDGLSGYTCRYKDILLEEGTTSTPYEPYKEQSKTILINEPLRSLPNGVKDLLFADKGYVERRVGKITIDKDLIWGGPNVQGETTYWICDRVKTKINHDQFKIGLVCNNLKVISSKDLLDNAVEGIAPRRLTNQGFAFRAKSGTITNIQAWFGQNPAIVYYELETPIQEPISKVTLKSYEGKTYIGTTNYIQPVVTAKALTNVSALLTGLKEGNEKLRTANEEIIGTQNSSKDYVIGQTDYIVDNDFRITMLELGL